MSSLYKQSIPLCIKYLKNLSGLLEKGAKFADEKGMKHEDILKFRPIADMRALPYQVQSASDMAKFILPRVGGLPNTIFEDNETTFPELQTRIFKTIELLQTVDPAAIDARADAPVYMKTTQLGTFKFETGQQYISEYAIPNFHFHLSTAYCILRHLGVPVSAFDFLGKDTFVKVEEE